MFRKDVFLIETNLLHLSSMINMMNREYLTNVIINPTVSSFFIPVDLTMLSKLVSDQKIPYNVEVHSDYNITRMKYDKKSKQYVEHFEENFEEDD